MSRSGGGPSTRSQPRVLAVGVLRHPLDLPADSLLEALSGEVDLAVAPLRRPLRDSLRAFRITSRAIRDADTEIVHLLDARFAAVGVLIRRQFSIPVTVSIASRDTCTTTPWRKLSLRAAGRLDEAFVSDDRAARVVRSRAPSLPVTMVPPAASVLPWPSARRSATVTGALRNVHPDRLVVAMPWPDNRNDLRWFRDFVLPGLRSRPVCLLFGVPSRREARLLLRVTGADADVRLLGGVVDADVIAAIARRADVFAAPSSTGSTLPDATSDLALALACAGIPVVTSACTGSPVLAHERNALVVAAGDEHGFVDAMNDVLALPGIQRRALGEDFARCTLAGWPSAVPAEVYAERFAALVGRPRIPSQLRAA